MMCENDEPISPSSSEASSDTDADPEEQELAMELGEPAPAVEHGTNPKPPAQVHGQAGHRQHRCHTPLDLTRSQKVGGTGGQTPGSVSMGAMSGMGQSSRRCSCEDACALLCPGESQGMESQRGGVHSPVLWGMLTSVCPSCRCGRPCCRPPSRAPRWSCPLPPGQVRSPSPHESTVPGQGRTLLAAGTGST